MWARDSLLHFIVSCTGILERVVSYRSPSLAECQKQDASRESEEAELVLAERDEHVFGLASAGVRGRRPPSSRSRIPRNGGLRFRRVTSNEGH